MKMPLLKKASAKQLSSKELLLAKLKAKKKEPTDKYFISSGSDNLNLALTGDINKGYCVGRMINIVGDYSTGKTLLACEAINSLWYLDHLQKGKRVKIVYDENESAFDLDLAESFGMPLDHIEWEESGTVENFKYNIWKHIKAAEDYDILLYVVDSLDSMSDEKELENQKKELKTLERREAKAAGEKPEKEGEDDKLKGDYGAKKAKELSKFFRTTARDLKRTNCILLIISQIRDDLKAKYGTKALRSGGKGMDFYATNVIWLDEEMIIQSKTFKIPQGATIGAYVRKNKVYSPRRRAKFDLLYTHGIENFGSLIDFCADNGGIKKTGGYYEWNDKKYYKTDLVKFFDKSDDDYQELKEIAQETWDKMEADAKIDLKPKWRNTELDDFVKPTKRLKLR